ncbi:hypothetical protein [Streptomyces sp. ISL-11]|uniref:hypothetical protein n=1 Tax=Streptomyces sp. ISL-11 TaxID=2819174 RepID=UPI001BEAF33A|nr:hypothetical protein [Streptomyces sp. ISL-11]MBT2387696.1 hypothetical protein [Streptomyces sp. ISL-11]
MFGMLVLGFPNPRTGLGHALYEGAGAVLLACVYAVPLSLLLSVTGGPVILLTLVLARWTSRRRGGDETWYRCLAVHLILSTAIVPPLVTVYTEAKASWAFGLSWWSVHVLVLAPALLVARRAADRKVLTGRYAFLFTRVAATTGGLLLTAATGYVAFLCAYR